MDDLNAPKNLPTHVGIIMDGNRRWAKMHHLPVSVGHSNGAENFKKIALYAAKIGLKYLTVYAFSTENWSRAQAEVDALLGLFKKYLSSSFQELEKHNTKINFLGDISKFDQKLQELLRQTEQKTHHNTGMQLNIALNYGSHHEITQATQNIAKKVLDGKIKPEEITPETISQNLYTAGMPELDLVIRTGNEQRLSNFLLWQAAYAEFYFTPVMWPEFNENEFNQAMVEYSRRTRKFGGK